ncbi:MAG: hypothetical protein IIC67_09020 [Thaumarchaeota archaeon]|nr:hypothetical protein [Nitrososphaerota archaeon]
MGITEKRAIGLGVGFFLIVIIIIIIIFVLPIPMSQFVEKIGLNTIEKINFSGNDVYYAIGGSLFNSDRPNYVLVGDQLWYSTLFQTKLDYPIELHATFQVFVGGKNVTNLIHLEPIPKFTLDDRTNGAHWEYYATEEGRNKIKADLRFINSSNGVLLHNVNKTTEFDVVSPAFALQDQSNKTTSWALTASVTVGVFTVVALVSSTLYSRSNVKALRKQNRTLVKQNKELKEQYSIQNRPWISIISERAFNFNGSRFEIIFQNYGKSVAHDVKPTVYVKKGAITKDEIIKHGTIYSEFDISPNETYSQFEPISSSLISDVKNTDDVYVGILMEYYFENTKKGTSLLVVNWVSSDNQALFKIKKLT